MKDGYDDNKPLNIKDLQPIEFKILVKLDVVDEMTNGGILLPDSLIDREQYAAERGRIISMAKLAFNDDSLFYEKPEVGDRVLFAKYAGMLVEEVGEKREMIKYRLMNDKDVCAILR